VQVKYPDGMATPISEIAIDRLQREDWDRVRAIYAEGISTGEATFEQTPPPWEEWDKSHLPRCRLAARLDGDVLAWAALSPISSRRVYAGVAEVSIYVSRQARRKGVGLALLAALVAASEREGIWTLQAGIFPENLASTNLHKRLGFRIVGIRERLGYMNGRWRDVILMERRSSSVGVL